MSSRMKTMRRRRNQTRRNVKAVIVAPKKTLAQRANSRVATVGMVKKILHKNAETKYVGITYNASFNNKITAPGDVIQILPDVPIGPTNNGRIGNKITPRGLKVVVTLTSISANPGAGFTLLPRLFVLSAKSLKEWTNVPSQVDLTKLLDDGTGERPFAGDITDYQAPVNKEYFIVHKDIKTKICLGTDEQNLGRTKTFTFWIKCPKVLNFDDAQVNPNNFAPFLSMAFACSDFSVPSDGYTPMKLALTSTLYYEDA